MVRRTPPNKVSRNRYEQNAHTPQFMREYSSGSSLGSTSRFRKYVQQQEDAPPSPSPFKKIAGALSGATVGFISGNMPGALVGGVAGYELGANRPLSEVAVEVADVIVPGTASAVSAASKVFSAIGVTNSSPNTATMAGRSQVSRRSGSQRTGSYRSSGRVSRRAGYRSRYRKRGYKYRVKKKRTVKKRFNKKKFKKNRKMKKKKVIRAATKGVEIMEEIYGEVADNHCVYLKHSTFNQPLIAKAIGGAYIRYLIDRSGFELGSDFQPINMYGVNDTTQTGYRILMSYKNSNATTWSQIYKDLGAADSVDTLSSSTGWNAHYELWLNMLENNTNNTVKLIPITYSLQMYDAGAGGTETWKTHTQIQAADMNIHLFAKSLIKIQNRTKPPSSAAVDTQADTVDNQPLYGKLYLFNHGDPRFNNLYTGDTAAGYNMLDGILKRGIELTGSASSSNANFQNPPKKSFFSNCVSVKNVGLPVGESQQSGIAWSCTGQAENFLAKLMSIFTAPVNGVSTGPTAKAYGVKGKSQIIALQEYLHTANTNKITVGYERQYTIGCYVSKKKKGITFESRFSSEAYNVTTG